MLSKKLKIYRERFGFTQKQIADILNIDRSTYSYYEIGKSYPTLDTLIKIAQIFKVSIDELLGYEVKPVSTLKLADNYPSYNSQRSKDSELAADVSALTSEEKSMIIAYRILSDAGRREVNKAIEEIVRKNSEI